MLGREGALPNNGVVVVGVSVALAEEPILAPNSGVGRDEGGCVDDDSVFAGAVVAALADATPEPKSAGGAPAPAAASPVTETPNIGAGF